MKPYLSVIIPSHNRINELRRAVKSVRSQVECGYTIEIIVVNDGSHQPEYYEPWPDVDKMLHLNPGTKKDLGYACAGYVRNVGMRAADGEYFAFLDDDDFWEPTKLRDQLATGAKLVCTEGYLSGDHNKVPFHSEVHASYDWNKMPDKITRNDLNKRNLILTSSVLVHRSIVKKTSIPGFITDRAMGDRDGTGIFLDWEFWKELAVHESFTFVKTPLVGYCHLENQQY